MNTDRVLAPGILTLSTASNNTVFNINNKIPPQTLQLRNYRIEFVTDTAAKLAKVVYVELHWLSSEQLTDGTDFFHLPLPVGPFDVTLHELNLPIFVIRGIPNSFRMRVLDEDGDIMSSVAHITLQFTYDYTDSKQ
jgi:hypothetical protein